MAESAMQDLLAANAIPTRPAPGEFITGKVVHIQGNRIIVELGGAYTGIITGREAIDGLGTAKELNPGDDVQAFVVEDENDEGYFVLSLRKAGREKAWDRLTSYLESEEAIEVRIKEANKGGLMTEVSGIRAFIPVSQLAPEHYPRVNGANAAEILRRLQSYVGEKFTVRVITCEKDNNKLILSEKAAIGDLRATEMKKLKIGQKVKGKVSGIVNFGLFLLFNDHLEGLVHVSEIDWGRVSDPAAHARLGEEKEAVVIGIEDDKISLSIKRLTKDPWADFVADLKIGDTVDGEVTKITPFGAFVQVKEGLNGLVHISEIAQEDGADRAEVNLEVGDKVEARIVEIDVDEHRLGLSTKPAAEKVEEKEESADEE